MSSKPQIAALIAKLQQFSGGDGETYHSSADYLQCPMCHRYNFEPHTDDCPIGMGAALANAVSALLTAEGPATASTGWQPIETAPKDGTRVFVYGWQCGVSLFGVGHWFQPRTIKELGGWICHTLPLHEFVNGTFTEPTHWIPLPKAPGVDGGALPASEAEHTGKAKGRAEMNDIPRRIRLDHNTPAELAIRAAVDAVEALPADVRLTEAVNLLWHARERVADFVDDVAGSSFTVERADQKGQK